MSQIKMMPYPVLGKNGYRDSTYCGKVHSITLSENEYNIKVSHLISNNELEEKIENGEFRCITSLENSSFFKETQIHNKCNEIYEIKIPRAEIRGRFEIDLYFRICAADDVINYSNGNFEEFFSDYTFNFKKGDIIGEADSISIQLEASYEQLEQSESFLRFRAHPDESIKSIEFKTYQDHVTFYLPKNMHNEYKKAKTNGSKTLLGILVTPALMELLHHIRINADEYQDYEKYSWVATLEDRSGEELELFDTEKYSVFQLVNEILESPTRRSIEQLNALLNQIDENE